MSVLLIVAGVLVVLYGILRPERKLPAGLRKPSTLGRSAVFGLLCVAGAAFLSGPPGDDAEEAEVQAVDPEPAPTAGWPGGEAARDSAFRALAALVEAERYPEAADRALSLAALPAAAPWADSLRGVARSTEEMALYAQAQRLPASALQENWDLYGDLARRFPDSPRLGVYVERRDAYARRLIQEEARRYSADAPAPEPPSPPVAEPEAAPATTSEPAPTACCRVCIRGKPCGDTCIAQNRVCHREGGCAC